MGREAGKARGIEGSGSTEVTGEQSAAHVDRSELFPTQAKGGFGEPPRRLPTEMLRGILSLCLSFGPAVIPASANHDAPRGGIFGEVENRAKLIGAQSE